MATIGEQLVEDLRTDVRLLLGRLGHEAEDVRDEAERLVQLAGDVLAARLAGQDVQIAERAARAAFLDLAALSAQAVADGVVQLIETALRRITGAALAALRGW